MHWIRMLGVVWVHKAIKAQHRKTKTFCVAAASFISPQSPHGPLQQKNVFWCQLKFMSNTQSSRTYAQTHWIIVPNSSLCHSSVIFAYTSHSCMVGELDIPVPLVMELAKWFLFTLMILVNMVKVRLEMCLCGWVLCSYNAAITMKRACLRYLWHVSLGSQMRPGE